MTEKWLSRTREYLVWKNLIGACLNKEHRHYSKFGALGASVCLEWVQDFQAFLRDLGPIPDHCTKVERYDETVEFNKLNCFYSYTKQGRPVGIKQKTKERKIKKDANIVHMSLYIEKNLLENIKRKSLQLSLLEHRKVTVPTLIKECLADRFQGDEQLDMFNKS